MSKTLISIACAKCGKQVKPEDLIRFPPEGDKKKRVVSEIGCQDCLDKILEEKNKEEESK